MDLYQDPAKLSIEELRAFSIKHKLEVGHSGKGGTSIKKDFVQAYREYTDRSRAEKSQKERINIERLYDTPEFLIAYYDSETKAFWIKQASSLKRILFSTQGKEVSVEVASFILRESDEIKQKAQQYGFDIRDILALLEEFKQVHVWSEIGIDDIL